MYKVTIVDGDLLEYMENPCIESICFKSLTWEDIVTLCFLAIAQGFNCIVRQDADDGGST